MDEQPGRYAARVPPADLAEAAELQRSELRTWELDEVLARFGYLDLAAGTVEDPTAPPASASPEPVVAEPAGGEPGVGPAEPGGQNEAHYEPEGAVLDELAELTAEIAAPTAPVDLVATLDSEPPEQRAADQDLMAAPGLEPVDSQGSETAVAPAAELGGAAVAAPPKEWPVVAGRLNLADSAALLRELSSLGQEEEDPPSPVRPRPRPPASGGAPDPRARRKGLFGRG